MIRSMTAYASAEAVTPAGALTCELRNHRYLELSPVFPRICAVFESGCCASASRPSFRAAKWMSRCAEANRVANRGIQVDSTMLGRLSELALDMEGRFPRMRIEFTELLRFPGVLQHAEVDQDAQQAALLIVLDRALDTLTATREREGAKLADILREKLDSIERIVTDVRGWMPEIRIALRARLESRLADLKQPVDPGRLEQELLLQVTRSDVDEELDRLSTHISETRRVLGLQEPVGRRLDFLMQEFNREANTLGSKSVDARSTNAAVELKVLIEQMREQVQNIE